MAQEWPKNNLIAPEKNHNAPPMNLYAERLSINSAPPERFADVTYAREGGQSMKQADRILPVLHI
jgi:hypothetical protein